MTAKRDRKPGLVNQALAFIAIFLLAETALAVDAVYHQLDFPPDREQYFLVRSEFPVSAPVTELVIPNWTPGSYQIRNYAANIERISAVSGDGIPLQLKKVSKDRWRVDTDQAKKLVVDYEVFTPEISVRSSWASRAFSLVNGASVFLYTERSRELPQILNISTEPSRGDVFTALSPATGGVGFQAVDYDELVDTPVAVARAPAYRFTHNDHQYVLLNVGENEFWDGEKAARDVEEIVAETQSFWRVNPLSKPYWFLNFAIESSGGLEHDHSTVIMTGRRQMRDRKDYIKWLGIVAHEFFHVWNVRHMRPAGLEEYDYQQEQYTSQLWLAEGLTSYYDNLLMSRALLISPEEYMELLATDIHRLEMIPGRHARSVTEASFDAWIRHYQPNSNSVNSTISYYTKGAVIGFVLDTFLRKESKDRRNLDEVMRKMYELYSIEPYDSDAFERIVVEVGGPEAGEFLKTLLTTTVDPDVDAALDWYGLKLERNNGADKDDPDGETPKSGFGVIWDEEKTGMVVKTVLAGSSGAAAGIMPNDEVLAVGDERLTPANVAGLMTSFRPGDDTRLLVSRRGRIVSLDIKMETAIPEQFAIVTQSGFGERHIRRLQRLLGQSLRDQ